MSYQIILDKMLYHFLNIFGLVNKVFAQVSGETQNAGFSGTSPAPSPTIKNPLESESILDLLAALLNVIVQVGIPLIALAIVYSGFLFVKAQGNESELSEAKKTLYWTVIGAAIVLGALVISKVIQATVTSLKV